MADRATLFDDIDSMEPDRFAAHLAEDVSMRFGNAPPIEGRQAARDAWAAFCEGIDGVSHAPVAQWHSERRNRRRGRGHLHAQGRGHGDGPGGDDLPRERRPDRRLPDLHRPRAPLRD